MLCTTTHLGEGGTENPRIEVEVDFSLEAEVPALTRKEQLHKNCRDFFLRQMLYEAAGLLVYFQIVLQSSIF
jgi:hypothetical protein